MTVKRVQLFQKNLDLLADKVAETELRRRMENVLREAQRLAPVSGTNSFTDGVPGKRSGGRLRDSLRIGSTKQRGKTVIRLFSDARNSRGQQYANIVVKGSSPHVITGNPNLRFQWINRGVFVITPQVQHPGTEPNNFLLRALLTAFNR
jgi:hypothetical protein